MSGSFTLSFVRGTRSICDDSGYDSGCDSGDDIGYYRGSDRVDDRVDDSGDNSGYTSGDDVRLANGTCIWNRALRRARRRILHRFVN